VSQIEKANAEQGDKLDAKAKEESEKLVNEIKELIEKKDIANLKQKLDEIENVMKNFANYAAQQQAANSNNNSTEDTAEIVE
ncbi:molecular chaperone DnaK, partial [Mycoplasmopsis pullorum]